MKKLILTLLIFASRAIGQNSQAVDQSAIAITDACTSTYEETDYKNLLEIFTQNYHELVLDGPSDELNKYFTDYVVTNFTTLKVIRDAQKNIVGFITFWSKKPFDNCIEIPLLAINKKYQKMGLGSRLIAFVTEFAKKSGFKHIELTASSDTLAFYQKNGFSITRQYKHYSEEEQRATQLFVLKKIV